MTKLINQADEKRQIKNVSCISIPTPILATRWFCSGAGVGTGSCVGTSVGSGARRTRSRGIGTSVGSGARRTRRRGVGGGAGVSRRSGVGGGAGVGTSRSYNFHLANSVISRAGLGKYGNFNVLPPLLADQPKKV